MKESEIYHLGMVRSQPTELNDFIQFGSLWPFSIVHYNESNAPISQRRARSDNNDLATTSDLESSSKLAGVPPVLDLQSFQTLAATRR